jgi:hypothetical protein
VRSRSAFLILVILLLTPATEARTKNRNPSTKQSSTRPQPAPAQPGTFEARVEDFLRQSGVEFHKVKANSWYLLVNGKEMSQIRIILGAGPSSIAMGAVVVSKRDLRLSTEALQKLMKLSYDLNYVRVCIDSDDDLIVMSQLKDPWLNAAEFRTTINLVSSAADRAYAVMRPYLSSSTP